jgi:hypothetical protein
MKRINLAVRDDPSVGLVVAVTFPMLGTWLTRDVAISDDAARRLITDVEKLLSARTTRRLTDGQA